MEPLVKTICCPNCGESLIAFLDAPEGRCEACGFNAEVFETREGALARFRQYERDGEVIVSDPVPLGKTRWVVAHTRLLLV
jgi:hypothetical protein